MDFQFYPTPFDLALRVWRKFQKKTFRRILEPSAGNGALAEAGVQLYGSGRRGLPIDCCEIDASKHSTLRDKGFKVVGLDFLQFGSGAMYSEICLNPPFSEGARHVLKAWDILWDGEIVAILNAETVRNPFSKERQLLVRLIEQHGNVEFIEGAFRGEYVERPADVDVALVYLRKQADVTADIIGNLFEELRADGATHETLARDFREEMMPAMPNSAIENAVLAFNAAVKSMKDAAMMAARARYYAAMLGETMAVRQSGESPSKQGAVAAVQQEIGERYDELKDRAWANILQSTNVTSRLSSNAKKRLESEFDQIKKLEFSVSNIYGFLQGLIEKQGEIQIGMALDVFDLFSRYHSDNLVFFKGWRSNNLHRSCGMRLRTTRFILPGHGTEPHQTQLDWNSRALLADFDKVFAMLDGRREPEVGLVQIFNDRFKELRQGQRVSSSYFDIRYYGRAGTIHFFPRDAKIVDRLNRLVGRHRQWLPPEGERVADGFWLQYDKAEKFDKELREQVQQRSRGRERNFGCGGPLQAIVSNYSDQLAAALEIVDEATSAVLEKHGISTEFQITGSQPQILMLETA